MLSNYNANPLLAGFIYAIDSDSVEAFRNGRNGGSNMAYTGNGYTKADFQDIVVDGMGTVGASLVEWLDLIVLLIVLGFIIGIFVKLGNLFK